MPYLRQWGSGVSRIDDTHYCLGSAVGPHPFPAMVRDFQAVISREIREQIIEKEGRLPDAVIACVGRIQCYWKLLPPLLRIREVALIGTCEAAGRGWIRWRRPPSIRGHSWVFFTA